ncbi:hypothetical protein A2706_02375 [Candidatus Peribacteria bacterium RIFCSPHIGHO2_01_FULL_51_35]|nr:MAG: hypothetical protein A2706_02375 [Candidatus Peribacteria bacterium RIFCSPHIGHO2_01_FULL_51_35]
MDLRNFSQNLEPFMRVEERRKRIESELGVDLSLLSIEEKKIGQADEKNCEQMFGAVPIPVGLAGPLTIHFSSGEVQEVYLPLATTEGALIASVNRGCKALSQAGGVHVKSEYKGITRSIAFEVQSTKCEVRRKEIEELESEWKKFAEATSDHLKVLSYEIDAKDDFLFLTIAADTDEAMGMNMITIAADAVGHFLSEKLGIPLITIAANVDSDKKPSERTKKLGRGYDVRAEATLTEEVLQSVLRADAAAMLKTAHAKLEIGSSIAGSLGKNLHAANIVAALYLAMGQDAAHVVEGSLTDTRVEIVGARHAVPLQPLRVSVHCPAILVGVRGGGTALPAQKQCLDLLLKNRTSLHPSKQLAESIGAAVLAGEVSLLAAQATNTLAESHKKHARKDH